MRVVRKRRISATPGALWSVIADPYHLPRWWPRTSRVENVTSGEPKGRKWTQVLQTKDGRGVRTDFRCVSAAENERYIFEQLLEGTPFARTLRSATTEINLEPEGASTEVAMTRELKLRGLNRFGGFMFRRATGSILADALAGLENALGADDRPAEAAN